LIRSLIGHTQGVSSVSFSPDGKWIASGSWDYTVKNWDSQSGKLIRSLIGHKKPVTSVSFSPDGKWIASGSEDNTVKIWDSQSGKLIRSLIGHKKPVTSVSFSPDGRRIVSGSIDSSLRLWDSVDGSLICTLQSLGPQDYITYTSLGYYVASEAVEQYAPCRIGSMVYFFAQYCEQFNRPDLVAKALLSESLKETVQMPSKNWRPKPYILEKCEGIDVRLLTNLINYIEGDVRAYVTQIQQWTKGSTPYYENTWLIKEDFDNDGIKEILLSAPYLKRLDISTEGGANVSTIQHGPVCPVSLFLFESKKGLFFPVARKEMHSPEFFTLEDFNSDGVKEIVVLENWCGAKVCGKNVHVFRWSEHHWEELNLTDGASKYISESVHQAIRKSGVQLIFE
jgi:hypothetical protein